MEDKEKTEYLQMKMNYNNYKSDAETLEKLYKKLVKLIPISVLVSYLKQRKVIKFDWDKEHFVENDIKN